MRGQKSSTMKGKIESAFARLEKLGLGKNNEDPVDAQDLKGRAGLFT